MRGPEPEAAVGGSHPRFAPPKLYGEAADLLAAWLKMRCADGLVPGGAPGIVLTGRAGCGKMSAVRWAMRQAGLDVRALEILHPWSCESAAGLERQLVNAAMTVTSAGAGSARRAPSLGANPASEAAKGSFRRRPPRSATSFAPSEFGATPSAAAKGSASRPALRPTTYAPQGQRRTARQSGGSVILRSGPSRAGAGPASLPYRVLVVRHAELWALRSAAAALGERPPSARDVNTLAYWSKLTARVVEHGRGSTLPRVAIILLFPDISHPKPRGLVGLRRKGDGGRATGSFPPAAGTGEDGGGRGEMELGQEEKGEGSRSAGWKHVDLDDHLLRGVVPLSARIARVMGWTGGPVPFDGDLRALFRRRQDECRKDAPHHLDLNYNIFRASQRLLGDAAMSPGEVRAAVEGDARLVYMVWAHAATHRQGIGLGAAARDRELWSEMDARRQLTGGGEASGWAVLEWRLTRTEPWARLDGLRFERMPFVVARRRAGPGPEQLLQPARGAAKQASARKEVAAEYGFVWRE
jgi:hypothetical protein